MKLEDPNLTDIEETLFNEKLFIMNFDDVKFYCPEITELYHKLLKDIDIYNHYISKNAMIIDDIKSEIDSNFNKLAENIKDEKEHWDLYSEKSMILETEHEKFKEINYKTMVLHIYSFLESNLRELVILAENKLHLPLNYKDIRADDQSLKLYKKYFEKVGTILFSKEIIKNWTTLGKYQTLRNAIAHNYKCEWSNINLPERIKELGKLIDTNSSLKKDAFNETFIICENKFLTDFVELVNKFLVQLFDVVQEKINNKI